MKRLPELITECPEYNWNQSTQMFEAVIYVTSDNGERAVTDFFVISPHVFMEIRARLESAIKQFDACSRCAAVVPIRKAEGG